MGSEGLGWGFQEAAREQQARGKPGTGGPRAGALSGPPSLPFRASLRNLVYIQKAQS